VNENNTKGNVSPLLFVPLRLYKKEEIMQLSRNPLVVMTHHRSHGPSVWSVSTYINCAEIAAVALQQWLACDALLNSLFKVR